MAIRRVAILRFGSVGDVVLMAPALHALALAWPGTQQMVIIRAALAPLVTSNPHVHTVVRFHPGESLWTLRSRLAQLAPGAVLDLHGKLRSRLLSWMIRVPQRVCWNKRPWHQTLAVRWGGARYRAAGLITARYHQAVESLVGHAVPPQPLRFYLAPEDRTSAALLLDRHGLGPSHTRVAPLVALAPGAMWATKRWPLERFSELARWALKQGLQVVILGCPSEAPMGDAIQEAAPGAVNLMGDLNLGTLAGVIEACRAFVGHDSGPMHISRALGVPTLAIFGSTDPAQFDFTGHALLFRGEACAPCSFYGRARCPRKHFNCLKKLDVAPAQQALESLLRRTRVGAVLG